MALLLLVVLTAALGHWFLGPFTRVLTPVLSLSWLGWVPVVAALWLFAGRRGDSPGED